MKIPKIPIGSSFYAYIIIINLVYKLYSNHKIFKSCLLILIMQINIQKRHLVIIFSAIVLLGVIGYGIAYGTSNPSVFGHSAGEVEGVSLWTKSGDNIYYDAGKVSIGSTSPEAGFALTVKSPQFNSGMKVDGYYTGISATASDSGTGIVGYSPSGKAISGGSSTGYAGFFSGGKGVKVEGNLEVTGTCTGCGGMKVAWGTANHGAIVNLKSGTVSSGTYNGDSGFKNLKGVIVSGKNVRQAKLGWEYIYPYDVVGTGFKVYAYADYFGAMDANWLAIGE